MSNLNKNIRIYASIRKDDVRSHMEDTLVLDGFDISTFATASELWDRFQDRPARMVITDRRFEDGISGLDLARNIRQGFMLPYVFVIALSMMVRIREIEEALAAGADDYLAKPYNPVQIRTRVMVGLRWLAYIDSLYAKKSATSVEAVRK
jgi:DNA-binding response OmpR family regulator